MAFHPETGPFDLQAFREGNVKVFAEVFNANMSMIYLMAIRLLRDESEAQDVVAEMYLRLWKNRMNINDENHVKAFLVTGTQNSVSIRSGQESVSVRTGAGMPTGRI